MEQRINIDLNRELWRQLSIRCAELDLLKKDAVEEAIGDWLKKTEEGEEMTYSIHDRENDSYEELTEEQAQAIFDEAELHTGPFGGMGRDIDQAIYSETGDDIAVEAIRYNGAWFTVPESQSPHIEHELDKHSYEEPPEGIEEE